MANLSNFSELSGHSSKKAADLKIGDLSLSINL